MINQDISRRKPQSNPKSIFGEIRDSMSGCEFYGASWNKKGILNFRKAGKSRFQTLRKMVDEAMD